MNEIMKWVEYFIGAYGGILGIYYIARVLLKEKAKGKIWYRILLMSIFAIFTIANSLALGDNIAKTIGTLLVIFCIYYYIYKQKFNKSFSMTFFTYMAMMIGEATFALIASLIVMILEVDIMKEVLMRSSIVNIMIAVLSVIFSIIFRKWIRKLNNLIKDNNIFFISILGLIAVMIGFSSIYNLFTSSLVLDYKFILNMIIIVGCSILTLILIKQYLKNRDITDKYELLEDYMKTSAELIEKYSSTVHKYKNNLIAIKGYMKSDMEEANEYVDNLLKEYKLQKYKWLAKTNRIKIDTIRYIVYYKLSKAEEMNLKISVIVSEEIKEIEKERLRFNEIGVLLDTLGEYFDNAIYASCESEKKELSFDLACNEEEMIFTLANTYKGEVDLSMITKNGYTTKGKEHGFGLYDIEKNTKLLSFIEYKYELLDDYFVVTLKLKLKNKK